MSGENKKTGTDHKIMSFQISEEEMQDPKLDSYVRESLIREADELEEELNQRPDLAGVRAPEGMYQSIVDELKARGTWEEEDAEPGRSEAGDSVIAGENSVKLNSARAVDAGKDVNLERKAVSGEEQRAETDGQARTGTQTLEALYAQLPEEDQKALALGKEVAQRKEAKAGKRLRRRKIFRVVGVAAACLVLVFGISMTSDANRRLVQRMWDGWMTEFGFKVNTDYSGDMETVRSKSKAEIEAMEEISEQLGSPSLDFPYLPKGMKYEGYEIESKFVATLFYLYKDNLFYVTIMNIDEEGSYYYKYDNDAVFQEIIETFEDIEAKIWEVNTDISAETYVAEIEYNGWRYVLNGMIPLEAMEKIIQYISIA